MPLANVQSGAFRQLASWLRLSGSRNVQQIQVEPAQPVLDLSRIAQAGTWVRTGIQYAHAAASTERDAFVLSSIATQYGLEIDRTDFWLMNVQGLISVADIGNLTVAQLGVRLHNRNVANQDEQVFPLVRYNTASSAELIAGEGSGLIEPNTPHIRNPFPILLRPNAISGNDVGIYVVSVSSAAITSVRWLAWLWAGERGMTPPGMS